LLLGAGSEGGAVVKIQSLRLVPRRPGNGSTESGGACALHVRDTWDGRSEAVDGDALLALLAAGDPPAFATDSRDRVVFWNRGMADLVGRTSHGVLGRRCYETLQGRDLFGNRFCYANCPVIATLREGDPVCGFELTVSTGGVEERRAVGLTILKVPGARPDLFTLVHVVQPIARDGRVAELLCELAVKGRDVVGRTRRDGRGPAAPPPPLTRREMEVLGHVASGLQNKEVAQTMGLSVATVRNHIHNILDKVGVHSKLEAVSLAFRNGWIPIAGDPPAPSRDVDKD
jgi:DNA-binding CsgD family transcriptional regulator/PAS domain-containing protein